MSFPILYTSSCTLSPVSLTCSWPIEQTWGSTGHESFRANKLLVLKYTFGYLCLTGREVPAQGRDEPSLNSLQLGITGWLPAAESCKAFRKILLPCCLNLAPELKKNRGPNERQSDSESFFSLDTLLAISEIVNYSQTKQCKPQKFSANMLHIEVQLH